MLLCLLNLRTEFKTKINIIIEEQTKKMTTMFIIVELKLKNKNKKVTKHNSVIINKEIISFLLRENKRININKRYFIG